MKTLYLIFIALLLVGCGSGGDYSVENHYDVDNPSPIDEDEPIVDIGDPYSYPDDYGITDGIVIINECGWPITSITINDVVYDELFIQNNRYFSVEFEIITDKLYIVEIDFVNGKSTDIGWSPTYLGPQLIVITKDK